jgi:hypothetical protein
MQSTTTVPRTYIPRGVIHHATNHTPGILYKSEFLALTTPRSVSHAGTALTLHTTSTTTGDVTYTPTNPEAWRGESTTYELCNANDLAKCDSAAVTIDIEAVNDAPVATDDGYCHSSEME